MTAHIWCCWWFRCYWRPLWLWWQILQWIAGSQYNATEEPTGFAGIQYNETLEKANATGNATVPLAAGEQTIMTSNVTSSHNMLATGNPILLLLGVTTVLGGAAY